MRSTKTLCSIREIDRQQWDDLAADNVLASHGWLKTVEETASHDLHPRYIVQEEDGRILAGCVCYRIEKQSGSAQLDAVLFGRMEKYAVRLGMSFLPHVMCRPFRSNGAHILVRQGMDAVSERAAMREILSVLEAEAFNQKLPVVFSGVLEKEAGLMEVLSRTGYHRTYSSPVSIIDLNYKSFDEYLKSLDSFSPNARKVVRREMNKNSKEGVTIEEVEKPGEHGDRFYELISGNYQKYSRNPFAFNRTFLESLKANLGDEARILMARKNGEVTGVSVSLDRNGYQFIPYVGVDHAAAGNDFTYFNLAYYHPIAHAIARGVRHLNCGTAFYDIKTRRGAKIHRTYIFHKSADGFYDVLARAWFKLHAASWSRKLARMNNGRPPRTRKSRTAEVVGEV